MKDKIVKILRIAGVALIVVACIINTATDYFSDTGFIVITAVGAVAVLTSRIIGGIGTNDSSDD